MTKRELKRYAEYKLAYAALMKFYPFALEDLDGEEWEWIPNYEGLYQVSTFGRVKSFCRGKTKILKPRLNHKGYLDIELRGNGSRKVFRVSRLVASVFVANSSNLPEVNHDDGRKFNNHINNLSWTTRAENMKHAVQTGLVASGASNYQAKFTAEQVVYIRENPDKLSIKELAEKFSCNERKVSQIQLGRIYKNVGGEIRGKMDSHKLTREIRNEIRSEYVKGSSEFGCYGLAKKYGVDHVTILNILKEVI